MTVFIILGVLFIALVIIVPLVERSNFRMSDGQLGKLSRWILPLVVMMVIIQLVMYYIN
jgi:hypothetical protein